MDIAVHSVHIHADDPDLESRVREGLARFADRLTRVEVFIKDTNADKGGVDKHCVIEARPRGLDPLTADAKAEGIAEALSAAIHKLQRVLDTRFGKLDDAHRH
jgi:hypothetical protein